MIAVNAEKRDKQFSPLSSVYDWVEAAIISLIAVVLFFTLLFRTVGVVGPSMQTTLYTGDRLLLTNLFYEPQRGDIVVIDRYTQEPLIKRVVAVGGDTIEVDAATGEVYLNGKLLDEPYLRVKTPANELTGPVDVPDGYIFVMGDNRVDSKDSRMTEIGLIDVRSVLGKAVFRLGPLQKFGIL